MRRVMKITAERPGVTLKVTIEVTTKLGVLSKAPLWKSARDVASTVLVEAASAVMRHIEVASHLHVALPEQRIRP